MGLEWNGFARQNTNFNLAEIHELHRKQPKIW